MSITVNDASRRAVTTTREQNRDGRFREIDSLRGLAAISLVLFHYTTRYDEVFGHATPAPFSAPRGHYGANLFFIVSGFVIFMAPNRTCRPFDFVVSRFTRLYPAYWVAVATTFVTVGRLHTLTTDNGKEFAQHERIAAKLSADFFFAHPYSSWERGANENMNGLIREFFPKKMRSEVTTKKDVAMAMHRLNHRPRKCLGFRTPHEVFMEQPHSRHNVVALQT